MGVPPVLFGVLGSVLLLGSGVLRQKEAAHLQGLVPIQFSLIGCPVGCAGSLGGSSRCYNGWRPSCLAPLVAWRHLNSRVQRLSCALLHCCTSLRLSSFRVGVGEVDAGPCGPVRLPGVAQGPCPVKWRAAQWRRCLAYEWLFW
mmetsp:Transcript_35128/g.76907  ORF Transcript_35128/g.76907 Transcript_35128/m.76907 type:complete len:144 (+) Transcript_35128:1181-1612(+)